MQLRTLQDWVVRPRAAARRTASPTSSATAAWCARSTCSPTRSSSPRYGLTLADLEEALQARRRSTPAAAYSSAAPSSSSSAARACSSRSTTSRVVPRRHATTARRCFVRDVATVTEGWAPRQGVVSRGDRLRHRRGHRADAPRREPVRGARARCARRSSELNAPARRRRRAGRRRSTTAPTWSSTTLHTVGHNLLEGGAPGHARAVRLPARPARRADRRAR